ncbi:MAG: MarR family transcriptional regulator [Roseibium sp.]|uniref:MarR family winged helix-turn-helix transcriptional regulator n=1 Tax=Roseibium sp. TaxID=1936156 RepID=UPI001B2C5019|nr:MarR family transcriptional regulator [Roseibium sp.]MBO6512267.1 MarR family transcriptional regulator [Roseibium sp.]MBO6891318.1 MarR family transcriptional regulator [Roseibium sp.]MBO6931591.1 MarR family transcriptional regulator [Roseibium sp.]
MDSDDRLVFFRFFNEIGIISQLSRSAMEARLPKGLTLPHFSVVNHLIRVRDGQTPLALARAFQVPKTTMTHTLSGLLDQGMVEMRPNPKDGRSKTVWLTDKGRSFREDAIVALDPDMMALADHFSSEQLQKALPLLEEIRKFMDAYRD